jgi:hypothetical protein
MDCFAEPVIRRRCAPTGWLAMTGGCSSAHSISISKHDFTISRLDFPEVCYRISLPSIQRAQGMPGARCTRGLVCKLHKKMRTRAYRFSGGIRHSLRNGFTAYIVLSPADRACCHRHQRNCFHQLDASIGASGPHDFAVRISAVRQGRIHVHRIPSRVRDDRETPLVPGRNQIDILLIWARRQANFGKSEILSEQPMQSDIDDAVRTQAGNLIEQVLRS